MAHDAAFAAQVARAEEFTASFSPCRRLPEPAKRIWRATTWLVARDERRLHMTKQEGEMEPALAGGRTRTRRFCRPTSRPLPGRVRFQHPLSDCLQSNTMRQPTDPPFLDTVSLRRDLIDSYDAYPFSIPAVKHLKTLKLHPRVTFFIGENGTGKSTLMEAIAVAEGFNAEGGSRNLLIEARHTEYPLARVLQLGRGAVRLARRRTVFFCGPRASSTWPRRSRIWVLARRRTPTVRARCTINRTASRL